MGTPQGPTYSSPKLCQYLRSTSMWGEDSRSGLVSIWLDTEISQVNTCHSVAIRPDFNETRVHYVKPC